RQHVPSASGLGAAARGRQLDLGDGEVAPVGRGRADRLGAVRPVTDEVPVPDPDLAYYEAVPYLLVVESIERAGEWLRCAEHPERRDGGVGGRAGVGASEKPARGGGRVLGELGARGAPIPVPPPPLASGRRA